MRPRVSVIAMHLVEIGFICRRNRITAHLRLVRATACERSVGARRHSSCSALSTGVSYINATTIGNWSAVRSKQTKMRRRCPHSHVYSRMPVTHVFPESGRVAASARVPVYVCECLCPQICPSARNGVCSASLITFVLRGLRRVLWDLCLC